MRATHLTMAMLALLAFGGASLADEMPLVDVGEPFGQLRLIDEINCGDADDPHEFKQKPAGVSRIEDILGRPCRALPTEGTPKYFAYRIGKGKGLQAGKAYVLTIDYPEDQARTVYVGNRACETALGFATGAALGDTVYGYTGNNLESLKYPVSGEYQTWKQLFFMHDRLPDVEGIRGKGTRPYTPADGFWVVIAQTNGNDIPASAGAAVATIRLFEAPPIDQITARYATLPEDLPKRHVFWREEMADGVVGGDSSGLVDPIHWYEFKAKLMRFLAVNTYSKDLLEFGANQGWDSSEYGGDEWVYQGPPEHRSLWRRILKLMGEYGYDVLPMYEYSGSKGQKGLGPEKRAKTLGGKDAYTHITWIEKANADLTDPDTYEDFQKMLDLTVLRHLDKAHFLGIWLRPRMGLPVSFSDDALAKFTEETSQPQPVTREMLQKNQELYNRYIEWWQLKRRDFLVAMRDHLREKGLQDAVVMYGCDSSEPGWGLRGGKQLVTDDVARWTKLLSGPEHKNVQQPGGTPKPTDYRTVVARDLQFKSFIAPAGTWGDWEWQHAQPYSDPQHYQDTDGVMLTYSVNRAYTVSTPTPFDAFRTPSGLALIRHNALNENVMSIWKQQKVTEDLLGYYVCDVERAGPYCMLAEARAVANGDPRYIGYVWGNNYSRGFPQYVRNFNAAFLSLPALPSKVLTGAAGDREVVVRSIPTDKHGTYLAVVNTALTDKSDVAITLPAAGKVTNAATGEPVSVEDGKVTLSLYPCQLVALHIELAEGE